MMAKHYSLVLNVEMVFTTKHTLNHIWTLKQISAIILVPNVGKCSFIVMMFQNTLISVELQKPDLNVKLEYARKTQRHSKL